REKRLPPEEVVRLGREIACGLAAAHERDLIHRDIKPANIFLEARGEPGRVSAGGCEPGRVSAGCAEPGEPRGRARLGGFGLVRAGEKDAPLTQAEAILGTPAYMSPEQAQGEEVDARSDLFSLGCVLYRMATGEPPFKGATTLAVLHAVVSV